jgi:hypothetical protein
MAAVGRNGACRCGGEPYKDCCGRLPEAEGDGDASASMTTLAGMMRQALAAQQALSPREADRL